MAFDPNQHQKMNQGQRRETLRYPSAEQSYAQQASALQPQRRQTLGGPSGEPSPAVSRQRIPTAGGPASQCAPPRSQPLQRSQSSGGQSHHQSRHQSGHKQQRKQTAGGPAFPRPQPQPLQRIETAGGPSSEQKEAQQSQATQSQAAPASVSKSRRRLMRSRTSTPRAEVSGAPSQARQSGTSPTAKVAQAPSQDIRSERGTPPPPPPPSSSNNSRAKPRPSNHSQARPHPRGYRPHPFNYYSQVRGVDRRPMKLYNTGCGVDYKSVGKVPIKDHRLYVALLGTEAFEVLVVVCNIYHSRNNTIPNAYSMSIEDICGIFDCDLVDYQIAIPELYKRYAMRKNQLYGRNAADFNPWLIPEPEIRRFMSFVSDVTSFKGFALFDFDRDEDGRWYAKLISSYESLIMVQIVNSIHDAMYYLRSFPGDFFDSFVNAAAHDASFFVR